MALHSIHPAGALLDLWRDRAVVLNCDNQIAMAKTVGKRHMIRERHRQRRGMRAHTASWPGRWCPR